MRFNFPIRLCNTKIHEDESEVKNGQSITPAEMYRLTNSGRAVSMASLENMSFFDNIGDFEGIPLENQRGIDMNMLWEASETAKSKIKDFKKHQKRNSHVQNPTQAVSE